MAINLFNKYGNRANPPSIDYPQGSVKNRSAPDVKDGTPLDADWANDHQGFFQSILSYFGVTANGTPDKVGASQYFDALMSNPSETKRGMPLAATAAEAASLTNASKMLTPLGLQNAFSNNANLLQSGYQKLPSGLIIQWGETNVSGGAESVVVLPIAMPNRIAASVATPQRTFASTESLIYIGIRNIGKTSIGLRNNSGTSANIANWVVFGY